MLSRLEIASIRGTFMEHLWNFLLFKIAKWKPIWKPPYLNFIIARNSLFANAKKEVFAENLQFSPLNDVANQASVKYPMPFLFSPKNIIIHYILSLDTLRFAKQNTTDFSSVVFCR
jgi:hypothetical protein